MEEVGADINMKLTTENRYRMGKQLLGSGTAEEASRLRVVGCNILCKQ